MYREKLRQDSLSTTCWVVCMEGAVNLYEKVGTLGFLTWMLDLYICDQVLKNRGKKIEVGFI